MRVAISGSIFYKKEKNPDVKLKSISFITFRLIIPRLTTTNMVSETESMARESVIVVIDVKRSKGMVEALDWALKHVVRPKDTVIVVGILGDIEKKNATQCFPLNMRFNISGICEFFYLFI